MFRVKICGIRSLADSEAVAAAGGDAIGLNFYPRSSRYLNPQAARTLARSMPSDLFKVGVFVNEAPGTINEICRQVPLDGIQLHGDEPASLLAELPSTVWIMRAFRLREGGPGPIADYLGLCEDAGRVPNAVLVDAHQEGTYGGTGRTAPWQDLAAWRTSLGGLPLVLAGGLTPENVNTAIEVVQPTGVDTASGVESSPGVKDHEKVRRFVAAARALLAGCG